MGKKRSTSEHRVYVRGKGAPKIIYHSAEKLTHRIPCKIVNRSFCKTDSITIKNGEYGINWDTAKLKRVIAMGYPKESISFLLKCLLPDNVNKGKRVAIRMEDLDRYLGKRFKNESLDLISLIYTLCEGDNSVLTMSPDGAAGCITPRM